MLYQISKITAIFLQYALISVKGNTLCPSGSFADDLNLGNWANLDSLYTKISVLLSAAYNGLITR